MLSNEQSKQVSNLAVSIAFFYIFVIAQKVNHE